MANEGRELRPMFQACNKKQFERPTEGQMAAMQRQLKLSRRSSDKRAEETTIVSYTEPVPPAIGNLPLSYQPIRVLDVRNPVEGISQRDIKVTTAISNTVVDRHLEMICEFANRQNGRNLQGTVPVCHCLPILWYWDLVIQKRRPNGPDAYEAAAATLGLTNTEFWEVRQIFIPIQIYLNDNGNNPHHLLVVIHPRDKTVEVLDSTVRWLNRTANLKQHRHIFRMLAEKLGRDFIPGDWRMRSGCSMIQGPTKNCGVYALTNAMCLAFGYPMDFQQGPKAGYNKRLRIAMELAHGRFEAFVPHVRGEPVNDNAFHYRLLPPHSMAARPGDKFENLCSVPLVFDKLKLSSRARTAKYDEFPTKTSLLEECRRLNAEGSTQRMRGFNASEVSGPTREKLQLRDWMEERDELIRIGIYVPY